MKATRILVTVSLCLLATAATRTAGVLSAAGSAEGDDAHSPGFRQGHCLVYDEARQQVVLLSGFSPPNEPELDELWNWKGTRWERSPGTGPVARTLSAAVYDARRKRVVLFGGIGCKGEGERRGDTWEWDGTSWTQMADTSVGTRDHHVMAYDAARGKAVMYGGQTSDRSWSKDTWEWDGAKWSKLATPGPDGRVHFSMVYDSKRKRVVLFGGFGEDKRYHNDTWEWDGATWRKASNEGPQPRARHRMAFDSRTGLVILYGGDGMKSEPGMGFRVLDDMWTWDGARWTEINAAGPGKRFMHAMAYDAARGKTILYGGGDGQTTLDDTWEWDGKSWSHVK